MHEVITRWDVVNGGGGLTIMYFDDTVDIASVRSRLATFWGVVDGALATGTSWFIETSGKEIAATSGQLTGFWDEPTVYTGTGAVSGGVVPNASQVLIQWLTSSIVAGRRVRGRTFVPGLATTNVSNGELGGGATATILGAATAFANGDAGLVVWHRPSNTSVGSEHPVNSAGVWDELAVQRARRS